MGLPSLQPLHGPSHTVEKGGPNRGRADVQGDNERGLRPHGGYDGHKNDLFLKPNFFTPFILLFYPPSNPRGREEKTFPPCAERPSIRNESLRREYYITFEKGGYRGEENGERNLSLFLGKRIF
jgi:hypothetical protein